MQENGTYGQQGSGPSFCAPRVINLSGVLLLWLWLRRNTGVKCQEQTDEINRICPWRICWLPLYFESLKSRNLVILVFSLNLLSPPNFAYSRDSNKKCKQASRLLNQNLCVKALWSVKHWQIKIVVMWLGVFQFVLLRLRLFYFMTLLRMRALLESSLFLSQTDAVCHYFVVCQLSTSNTIAALRPPVPTSLSMILVDSNFLTKALTYNISLEPYPFS